jgi:hypothetical protein
MMEEERPVMEEERAKSATWSRVKERIGVALWTSFLAAGAETAAFFAYLDPWVLGHDGSIPDWVSARLAAYGAGFFFFWLFTFAGAALTAYMLDSSRNGLKRSERERP